jgi:amino acid transporter
LVSCAILLLTGGFAVFTKGNWDPSSFVSSYLYVSLFKLLRSSANNEYRDIPLVLVVYLGYKFIRKTKFVPLEDVPVRQAIEEAQNDPENVPIKARGWQRLNILWG